MSTGKFNDNMGVHHEKASRKTRSRDGENWDPTQGHAVTDKQKEGYSGGQPPGIEGVSGAKAKSNSRGRGGHMA